MHACRKLGVGDCVYEVVLGRVVSYVLRSAANRSVVSDCWTIASVVVEIIVGGLSIYAQIYKSLVIYRSPMHHEPFVHLCYREVVGASRMFGCMQIVSFLWIKTTFGYPWHPTNFCDQL